VTSSSLGQAARGHFWQAKKKGSGFLTQKQKKLRQQLLKRGLVGKGSQKKWGRNVTMNWDQNVGNGGGRLGELENEKVG